MSLNKNEKVAVFIAVVIALVFITVVALTSSGNDEGSAPVEGLNGILGDSFAGERNSAAGADLPQAEGLEVERLQTGSSDEDVAENGDLLSVHYVGTLEDGVQFDSSRDRGEAFEFILGSGQVIRGWELGVEGMRVGEVRKLIIQPELAYGENQVGPIPPNSVLIFEVELIGVEKAN